MSNIEIVGIAGTRVQVYKFGNDDPVCPASACDPLELQQITVFSVKLAYSDLVDYVGHMASSSAG